MTTVSERRRRQPTPARSPTQPARGSAHPRGLAELRGDLCLLGELLLSLSLFGPQPLGWMYLAAQLSRSTSFSVAWAAVVLGGMATTAPATLLVARRLEHARLRAAHESGRHVDEDLLGLLLVGLTIVLLGCFAIWFFIVEGPQPVLAPDAG